MNISINSIYLLNFTYIHKIINDKKWFAYQMFWIFQYQKLSNWGLSKNNWNSSL